MPKDRYLNGVNVSTVKNIIYAINKKPELANFTFRLTTKWIKGSHNHSFVNNFYGANQKNLHRKTFELEVDEHPILAGEDLAPNSMEHLLNALSACLTTTIVYHAAILGIRIDEMESEVEGDIDLRGFLGLSNKVRKGYQTIRINIRIKTDAENMERLKALGELSPLFDLTSNGTKVEVNIERK
jgi:uncharacterized OsmC-like protein